MVKTNKKLLLVLIILFVISMITFLSIIIQVPYTEYVTYFDKEPYSTKDCQNVELKGVIDFGQTNTICENEICDRTESYCVEKNFWGNCIEFRDRCIHNACTKYRKYCNLNIENIGDEGGTWSFNAYSNNYDTNEKKFIDTINVFIKPRRTGIGSWNFVYDAGENVRCRYESVKAPTERVCENVIEYRDIEKTKSEIRYCALWKKVVGKC